MSNRTYREWLEDAGRIAAEVVTDGRSGGWSGETAIAAEIERALAPFNIGYVDDMRGRWAKKPGGSRFFVEPKG
jgi:hypothetical protein